MSIHPEARSVIARISLSYWCLCLLLMTLCSGCIMLGPDFTPPPAPMHDAWLGHDKSLYQKTAQKPDWWQVFDDPLLSRLIQQAWQNNPDRLAAMFRIQEARARLGIAKSSLFPQRQTFGMEIMAEKLSEAWPYYDANNSSAFGSFQTGFDAVWEMDIWGRFQRGIEAAQAQLDASMLDHDDILVSLAAEVAVTYIDIRTLQQRRLLAAKNHEVQARTYAISRSRFQNGLSTELDMQQADALRKSTEAEIAGIDRSLLQSVYALCALTGQTPSALPEILANPASIPVASGQVMAGVPADMLRRRPDIRREERKAAAESALIGVAESELYPRLSLYGSIGIGTGTANGTDILDVINIHSLAAKFGPSVTWPIFNYGRLRNNVRGHEARFDGLLMAYRSQVLRALREVEDAMAGFNQSRRQVEALSEGVQASSRAVELALRQYQEGLEDYTRVLNSQQFLVQQQDQLTRSQGAVARYLIATYKARGGGWEVFHEQARVQQMAQTTE